MGKTMKQFVAISGSPNEFPSDYSGEAIVKYKNGEKFVGIFENGKKIKGTYYYSNKSTYDGFFVNDKKSGVGKLTKRNGEEFFYGNFENGKKKGTGFQKYSNGDFYYGEWKDNKKNGKGTYFFSSTKGYLSGEWLKGYLANGLWLTSNEFRFEGTFYKNIPKNKGIFSFSNDVEMNVYFKQLFNISSDLDDSNEEEEKTDGENIKVYWYCK